MRKKELKRKEPASKNKKNFKLVLFVIMDTAFVYAASFWLANLIFEHIY